MSEGAGGAEAPGRAGAPEISGGAGDLAAARLWAVSQQPYLAAALFALSYVPAPGLGTLGVDRRWRVYVDPAVFERWSVEHVGAVLIHEVHHLLRDHAGRGAAAGVSFEARRRWNLAADCEINDDLLSLPLPDPVLAEQFGLSSGQLAEVYYAALTSSGERPVECGSAAHGIAQPWEAAGDAAGGMEGAAHAKLDDGDGGSEGAAVDQRADERAGGDRGAGTGIDENEADAIRRKVAEEVRERRRAGGRLPGGLARWAEAFIEPTVDWRTLLAAEVRAAVANIVGAVDYSHRRPSRRTGSPVGRRVVLASLVQPVPRVAVVVDTSASMTDADLGVALVEIAALLRACGAMGGYLTVLACDSAVGEAQRVFNADQVRLTGGGGTDLRVGLAAAAELNPRPELIVVITDGHTPWPEASPGARVVVALVGDDAEPAGFDRPSSGPPSWARSVRIPSSRPPLRPTELSDATGA